VRPRRGMAWCYIGMCLCVGVRECVCVCMCACACACLRACVHACAFVCAEVYLCVSVRVSLSLSRASLKMRGMGSKGLIFVSHSCAAHVAVS
jgi:hypothetical protein